MNLVSTNYKTAENMDNIGERTKDENYYLTAADSEALKDIFENIADNIQTPTRPLGEDTIIRDTVSDYFKLPTTPEDADVKVYTANYLGGDENWENKDKWAEEVDVTNSNVARVTISYKNLEITGYDFDAHFLSANPKETEQTDKYGQKLIVEFSIEREDGFIGGNDVPTNNGAGIYSNGDKIRSAPDPTVNVQWRYDYATSDRSIYVGDTYADLGDLGDTSDANDFFWKMLRDGKYRTSSVKDENSYPYLPNGTNNDFVNITYTIKDSEDVPIAIATLNAGDPLNKDTLIWQLQNGYSDWDISKISENQKYTVSVTLSPANTTVSEVGEEVKEDTNEKVSNLYVFKPNITFKDQMVFLGDKVDLTKTIIDDQMNPDHNMIWECGLPGGEEKTNAEKILRKTSPKLTYGWVATDSMVGNDPSQYEPKVDTSFTVRVARSHAGVGTLNTDITDYTIKKNDEIISHDSGCISPGGIPENPEDRTGIDFVIHVVAGKIDITKVIDRKSLNTNHGDPIFTFKIERIDGDNVLETFYRTVRFDEEEGSTGLIAKIKEVVTGQVIRNAETLDRLPRGTYRVTELDSMRYQVTDASVETDTTCTSEVKEKSVIFNIGTPESSDKHSWEAKYGHANFANDKINDTSYSDTDVVVNKYKFDDSIQPEGQDDMESPQNP